MDDITIGVTEFVNNILVSAQPNDQTIDITVTETVETVLLDVSTTVQEVTVTATQNVIVENITVDYVNNENNIDINVTDGTQDVTLNVTPTLVEINILRSGGEVNILQFNTLADFPATGSSDYFYLAKDTNKLYRWTGSAYAEISATANAVWGQIIGTLSEQTDLQNALNLKAPINSPTFTGTVSGITKAMVGLAQVDNTSDLDKPISTATQTALNNKQPLDGDLTSIAALSGTFGLLKKTANNSYTIDTNTYLTEITFSDVTDALGFTPENAANKGIANGYASLNGDGKVPSSQLPSYVDDVIEVSSYATLPSTGETGKIYITLDTNKIYRWSGSVYVEVSSSAAVWGGITGTLSNQTDLQSALDAKQDDLNGTGFVKASGTTISYDNTTYYPASNPNGYTPNTGTVTSVAMTVPSAFSVSGSPITSSGTLAVTATGNTTQYIAGDGSLVTFPTMSTAGTLIREVRNTTGATLTKGTVVYISGATGNKPTVSKAIATGDSTSAQTFGLVQADIANNANGNVVCAGDITGIDTSALTEGAQLYLSSTTAGAYTTTKQYAPAHLVYIGVVTRAHPSLGQIEVNIQNGYELDELHNVAAQTPSNNDGLFYETSTSLWKNKSIATVLGYTPANGADYMALTGSQSIAGTKTFTGFGLFDNTIFIKQDSSVSFLAGYNSIDSDSTGIIFSLPAGNMAKFILTSLTASRDYTLPNASGTIALTSDIPSLAGYVATTGNQSIAGDKTFTGGVINDGDLYIKQDASYSPKTGYVNLFAGAGNILTYNFGNSNINQSLSFPSTGRVYSFPDAAGTLALTSDLHNAVTIGTANGLSLSTQVLSLGLASTSATGALSSTDWNTFNGKQSAISFSAPLANIGGLIKIEKANSTTDGYLSQGDWSTFNNKQNALTNPVTGTGTSSYIPKFTGTSAIGNSLLYDTGSVLLVGATSASDGQSKLELVSGATVGLKIISSGANGNNTFLSIQSSKEWRFLTNRGDLISGNQGDLIIRNDTDNINHIILNQGGSTSFYSNVGIGTSTPNSILEISAVTPVFRIQASDATQFHGIEFRQAAGLDAFIKQHPNSGEFRISNGRSVGWGGHMTFYTDTAERMRITSGGNVGIGTTAPATAGGTYTGLNISSATGASLVLTSGANLTYLYALNGSSDFAIENAGAQIFRAGSAERMRITSAGNVGIGTTSPGTKLETTSLHTSDVIPSTGLGGSTTNAFITQNYGLLIGTTYTSGTVWLQSKYRDTTGTLPLSLQPLGGNVGIGTTAPSQKLEVNNGASTAYVLVYGRSRNLYLGQDSIGAAIYSDGDAPLYFATNSTERMRITSGGLMLLGATSSYTDYGLIQITGDNKGIAIRDSDGLYRAIYNQSGTLYFYNGSNEGYLNTAGAWVNASDISIKKEVKNIEYGLNEVLRLSPKSYKMISNDLPQIGFIAQEVAEVLPELVEESRKGMKGLSYGQLTAVLVKAIQELKAELDTLKNK